LYPFHIAGMTQISDSRKLLRVENTTTYNVSAKRVLQSERVLQLLLLVSNKTMSTTCKETSTTCIETSTTCIETVQQIAVHLATLKKITEFVFGTNV